MLVTCTLLSWRIMLCRTPHSKRMLRACGYVSVCTHAQYNTPIRVGVVRNSYAATTPPREFVHKTQCHLQVHSVLSRRTLSPCDFVYMPRGGESRSAVSYTHRGMSEPAQPPSHVVPGSTSGGVEVSTRNLVQLYIRFTAVFTNVNFQY